MFCNVQFFKYGECSHSDTWKFNTIEELEKSILDISEHIEGYTNLLEQLEDSVKYTALFNYSNGTKLFGAVDFI